MPLTDLTSINKAALCYMNNPLLKRANSSIPYSTEQVDEFVKCQTNQLYFIENYAQIVSLDKGRVLFDMYPFQKKMVDAVENNQFNIFMLPRQSGKSTVIGATLLHYVCFNKNVEVAILANKGETAREILGRVKMMFEHLPWFLKPGVKTWNKGSIELSNGSKIISAATGSGAVRGRSFNWVLLDEFAHVQNDVEFYESTYPVISSGDSTMVTITSTPKGMNLFYKLWTDAEAGRNSFKPSKFHWHEHPKRDQSWYEKTIANIGKKQFDQEYGMEFFGSSDTLINGAKLQQLTFIDPIFSKNDLHIFQEVEAGKAYAVTVDVGEGIGKDYSVVSVFDISETPYKHVAIYRDNVISPLMLADTTLSIANKYNEAYVVIEANSVGKITADSLYFDLEYENVLVTTTKDSENIIRSTGTPGVKTTKRTKSIGCATLKTLIESDVLLVYDWQTITELSTFVKKAGSFSAEVGKNDDCVMTLVIFSWFTAQPYFNDITDLDTRRQIRDNLNKMVEDNHIVFGFVDDGTEETAAEQLF